MASNALINHDTIEADLPLNRLAALGANGLSSTELLAVLLSQGMSSVDPLRASETARRVLAEVRSLGALLRCNFHELVTIPGVDPEQAALLVVAGELGRRVSWETSSRPKVDTPEMVCQLLAQEYRGLLRECVCLLLLDTKYQLLRIEEISVGSLNESIAHPREIFRPAILHSAFAIVLTHNHPSGDPTPSQADEQLTRRVSEVGKVLGIELADHIIFGGGQANTPSYYSFSEEGLI